MMQDTESRYRDKFIVGVDFGEAVTGLALGKNGAVSPVKSVKSKDKLFAVQQICKLAKENKAAYIVVGLPLDIKGKETRESIEVRRFCKLIHTHSGTPILFTDEFGSTNEAIYMVVEGELPQKSRKKIDSVSAAVILKRFFTDEGF